MVEIIFDYNSMQTVIQANLNDSFDNIIQKFITKTQLDLNNLHFLAKGKIINKNEKIEKIMDESDKLNKRLIILVNSINNIINNTNIIKSNDIICPICKEICKYEIKKHKIKLYDCKNGHIIDNIKLNEFNNKQNIDISQIKCDKCNNKSKLDTFNHEFFICLKCNMNLCPLCKSIHDKTHSIINYDNKNYICNKHNETFVKYCKECKIDLCLSCINGHKNHNLISYEDNLIDIEKIRRNIFNLNKIINKFKMNLEEIINKFKKLEQNLDMYYNINNNIINNYEKIKNRNYDLLINLKNINQDIENEISELIYNYNYGYNLNSLLYLYSEINDDNLEIEIKYKPIKDKKLRLFGDDFINNNINKCKIIYQDEEYNLTKYLEDIDQEYNSDEIITIKLKGYNNVNNMSYMFYDCNNLSSLPDLSKWNTSNVNDMSYMFYNCNNLSSLPDLSKWNTSNVNNMSYMFGDCNNLSSLPDLSKWNTSNVNNMSGMFYDCKSSLIIPSKFKV